jgi:glycosyltransferase involved in cell wall biosynthesis
MTQTSSPIILWCGRTDTHDGYGTAARLHVGALRDCGAPVIAVDIESRSVVGPVPPALIHTDMKNGDLRIRAVDPLRPIVAVVHERPDRFEKVTAVGKSSLVGFSYWETMELPDKWAGLLTSMDRLWVGSEFNALGFENSGVPRSMIERVGHPVDPLLLDIADSCAGHRDRWPEQTVFLSVVSSAVGRRDLGVLFESYAMAFEPKDDVALVLKVPADAEKKVRETLEQTMRSVPARGSGTWPNVYVIADSLSREQLVRLHASVDCYVSCERGNGWDLPAMDSLALGVPVIATDYGASGTFLQEDDCYIVKTSSRMVSCDSNVQTSHPLYSGHYWPYLDPVVMSDQMKNVHGDPDGRSAAGKYAADRVRKEFDAAKISGRIVELTQILEPIDYRANTPAVVTVSKSRTGWNNPPSAPMERAPAVAEARLLSLLTPASKEPRALLRAYSSASSFATQNGAALNGTNTRKALSKVMAVSSRAPARKLREYQRLLSQVPRLKAPFGGNDGVAKLAGLADDYLAQTRAAANSERPDDLVVARRALWHRYGPFESPRADIRRLEELRDRHRGERVFIMGNGPSLTKCDLSMLANEYTFGVNKIHLLFKQIDWRPSFYTLLDWKMGVPMASHVSEFEGTLKFFPERFRGVLPSADDTYWYWTRPVGSHINEQFEADIRRGIPSRATVLVTAVQQAFFLGFRDIILIGVDAEYTIPDTVKQSGPDQFRTGVKLHLESTKDDDPNHFDPTYFGTGTHWHDPNVDDMHRMFRLMLKGVEWNGGTLRNATVGGSLDVVPRIEYESLFS